MSTDTTELKFSDSLNLRHSVESPDKYNAITTEFMWLAYKVGQAYQDDTAIIPLNLKFFSSIAEGKRHTFSCDVERNGDRFSLDTFSLKLSTSAI